MPYIRCYDKKVSCFSGICWRTSQARLLLFLLIVTCLFSWMLTLVCLPSQHIRWTWRRIEFIPDPEEPEWWFWAKTGSSAESSLFTRPHVAPNLHDFICSASEEINTDVLKLQKKCHCSASKVLRAFCHPNEVIIQPVWSDAWVNTGVSDWLMQIRIWL